MRDRGVVRYRCRRWHRACVGVRVGTCREALYGVGLNDVDEAPVIAPQSRAVVKNDFAGTLVGPPLLALDDDTAKGDFITWSIVAGDLLNGTSYFNVVPSTGQLLLSRQMDYVINFVLTVGTPAWHAGGMHPHNPTPAHTPAPAAVVLLCGACTPAARAHVSVSRSRHLAPPPSPAPFHFRAVPHAQVRVMDTTGLSATANVTVFVSDSNSRPVFTNLDVARLVVENSVGPMSPPLAWLDYDVNDTHVLTLEASSPPQGMQLFSVTAYNRSHANVSLNAPLNFECARVDPGLGCPGALRAFNLSISVRDSGVGTLTTFGVMRVSAEWGWRRSVPACFVSFALPVSARAEGFCVSLARGEKGAGRVGRDGQCMPSCSTSPPPPLSPLGCFVLCMSVTRSG
jgi:hypothetical protein